MSDENKPVTDIVAQMDQVGALLASTAPLMGQYYVDLRMAGVPPKLAHDLVLDFQDKFFSGMDRR